MYGQRFTSGLSLGTNVFFQSRLADNFVISENSYYVYYTFNEKKDYEPIHDQYFNNIQAGFNVGVDYKRFALSTEFLFSSTGIRIPLLYPSYLGALTSEQWNTFEVRNNAFKTNLLLSVKLLSRANSPFLLGGMQYSMNSYSEDQGELDSQVGLSIGLFTSKNELYGVVYNDHRNYFSWIGGIGIQIKNSSYSVRYTQRVFQAENRPSASFTQIELFYAYHLVFQKLRKGSKLYID